MPNWKLWSLGMTLMVVGIILVSISSDAPNWMLPLMIGIGLSIVLLTGAIVLRNRRKK